MKIGEELYCKVYQSPMLPRAVLTPNLHHGSQDLVIPKQEHPPTIKASEARSTRKVVARGTRKLVVVMSITEFKVYLTQQLKKDSNRKVNVKKTDSTVRDSPEQ